MAQDYRDLIVWQRAIDLTVCVYQLTRSFPRDEVYGLVPQMRRAAVSVASNIAEGRGRLNVGEFRQFLGLAQGSLYELQTQLLVARKLGMGSEDTLNAVESLSNEVSKMLAAFIQKLNSKGTTKQLVARS
jgi:four helix bundle protein